MSTNPAPPSIPLPPRYRFITRLGEGASGVVYEVLDTALDVRRAAKVLHAALASDVAVRSRFDQEARTLAKLSHPHLAAVHDVGETNGYPWMIMDLLSGGSLADVVARRGALPAEEVLRAMLGALDALAVVHTAGVIHRDVKPQNLLFDGDGRLCLTDFGIALAESADLTRTGAVLGSWGFMAPEQRLDARRVRPSTDLFGIAASITWALVGRPVSDLHVSEHRNNILRELPEDIAGFLHRALAFRPEERFRSAAEMAGAIRSLLGETEAATDQALVAPGSPTLARQPSGWRGLTLVGLAALASGVVLGQVIPAPLRTITTTNADTRWSPLPPCDATIREWTAFVKLGPEETVSSVIGDVDADGIADAVFTNQKAESVSIWWGQRGSMPTTHVDVPVGRSGYAAAVGDITGDGNPDLVLGLQDDSALALVAGLGNRTFAAPQREFQGPPPHSPLLHDHDGDGSVDLLFMAATGAMFRRKYTDGVWEPQVPIMDIEAQGSIYGIRPVAGYPAALAGRAAGAAFSRDWDGRIETWEERIHHWLQSYTPEAPEDAYAVTFDQQVIRIRRGEMCVVGPEGDTRMRAVGDLDADGRLDAVAERTCSGCTSNQILYRGLLGAEG